MVNSQYLVFLHLVLAIMNLLLLIRLITIIDYH